MLSAVDSLTNGPKSNGNLAVTDESLNSLKLWIIFVVLSA